MRSSMYVLAALLLMAAGCPGDSGAGPRRLDMLEAGRGEAGKAGVAGKGSAGGAAGSAAGSGGSPSVSVAGGTKLADITTDAQAAVVCDKVRAEIKRADFDAIDRGACTLEGLTGQLQGAGKCAELTRECLDELGDSSADDTCTAEDFPSCPNVSVDEFVACAKANLQVSTSFFGKLSCDTKLENLSEPETPPACASLFSRCPELNDSRDG